MTDQTTTITHERAAYDHLRARAIEGEHVPEPELLRALEAANLADQRAALTAELAAERAAHRKDEAADIKRRRKAGEAELTGLVASLVEAQEIRAQAHTDMAAAIREYDRCVKAQNASVYALRDALGEYGYPTAQPARGAESEHVHPERHPNGNGWVVFDGHTYGTAETARNAIPRFYHHLRAA